VRTFFDLLEKDQMITSEGLHYTTRLTVCNYCTYQGNEVENNTRITHETTREQHTDNTRITPNKNDKKEKNDKKRENIPFIPPTPEQVKAYAEENGITNTDLKEWFFTRTENEWIKVNGQPVKNWQLDLRTADRRGYYPKKVVY
jgi:hypothetical protein